MTGTEFEIAFDDMIKARRDEMKQRFDRVLPSGELIFNRFDKSKYLKSGEGSSVYDTSVVMGDVEIGRHVWVGPYTLLDGSGAKLQIGDFVSIDSGVMIYTHDSTKYHLSGGRMPFQKGPVKIGNNTVIGTMSIILCGVAIGDHCVIGANSLIKENVPPFSIVGGTPARVIGKVVVMEDGTVELDYSKKQ